MGKKKKDKPIMSKEEKEAKKKMKKEKQKERVKKKRERKDANRRKRLRESLEGEGEDEEEALANPASTSKKKKKKILSAAEKVVLAEKKKIKKIKKLEKMRKRRVLTKKEERRIHKLKSELILALWDYENLSYPKVGAFGKIEEKLRREGFTGELELHAIVGYKDDIHPVEDGSLTMHYGDPDNPRPVVGSKKDQKADEHMYSMVDDFLDAGLPPQNILLITNDNGFAPYIERLVKAGHCVLLATTQQSLIISAISHEVWSWKFEIVEA